MKRSNLSKKGHRTTKTSPDGYAINLTTNLKERFSEAQIRTKFSVLLDKGSIFLLYYHAYHHQGITNNFNIADIFAKAI